MCASDAPSRARGLGELYFATPREGNSHEQQQQHRAVLVSGALRWSPLARHVAVLRFRRAAHSDAELARATRHAAADVAAVHAATPRSVARIEAREEHAEERVLRGAEHVAFDAEGVCEGACLCFVVLCVLVH